jgi:hypothetical protein
MNLFYLWDKCILPYMPVRIAPVIYTKRISALTIPSGIRYFNSTTAKEPANLKPEMPDDATSLLRDEKIDSSMQKLIAQDRKFPANKAKLKTPSDW